MKTCTGPFVSLCAGTFLSFVARHSVDVRAVGLVWSIASFSEFSRAIDLALLSSAQFYVGTDFDAASAASSHLGYVALGWVGLRRVRLG